MVIVMKERATEEQIETVVAQLLGMGFDVHKSHAQSRTVIGAVGSGHGDTQLIAIQDGVQEVLRITEPYKLASRTFKPENTVIEIGDVRSAPRGRRHGRAVLGRDRGDRSRPRRAVKRAGAKLLRGGAFKPRSSPYSFQGLGEAGLQMLRAAADRHDLKLITEVMEIAQIASSRNTPTCCRWARATCRTSRCSANWVSAEAVLLKRGISATIEEWLLSAEYVLAGGNKNVMLCERGIRTFESYTRNTLDISAIPVVQQAQPPAGHRRPEPRHGPTRQSGADGPRRRGRRRRRLDHRGALRSGSRADRTARNRCSRRSSIADGGTAHHRAGDRPQHLRRVRRPSRLEPLDFLAARAVSERASLDAISHARQLTRLTAFGAHRGGSAQPSISTDYSALHQVVDRSRAGVLG
jgi:3-deoxy-7-phosphoheptulonate synthase